MLQIRLLGQFDVRLDGKRIVISSRAGQSLLAYLAMTAGTPHRREKLAGILWPDIARRMRARICARNCGAFVKPSRARPLPEVDEYLIADEFTLRLTERPITGWMSPCWRDSRPDLQSLTSSLSLYQGELLPGFYDDWVVLERERIQTLFETKMDSCVRAAGGAGALDGRAGTVRALAGAWAAPRTGLSRPDARLTVPAAIWPRSAPSTSAVWMIWRISLGVEPSAETHALYNGLLKGRPSSPRLHACQALRHGDLSLHRYRGIDPSAGSSWEISMPPSLAEHHRILRAAIQKWNGQRSGYPGRCLLCHLRPRPGCRPMCCRGPARACPSHLALWTAHCACGWDCIPANP